MKGNWWKVMPSTILLFLLTSCGVDSGRFRITGDFKNFNQGEFYVYSPDAPTHRLDTIMVMNGHFTFEVEHDDPITYVIIFPNYSELPVFSQSGKEITIKGDASNLKEVEVNGSEENDLMTTFRLQAAQQTPPEVKSTAAQFITDHPQTLASLYILNKYFIQSPTPDYAQALSLARIIAKENPKGQQMNTLIRQLEGLKELHEGGTLPKFTATDINGKPVSSADLYAKVNVIHTWASWNYDSQNALRKLKRLQMDHGADQLRVVSVCLDANLVDCRRLFDRDSIKWSCICDGRMWEMPVLKQVGLYFVPDNIITDSRGRIKAHSVSTNELDRKIEELLR